MTDMDTTDRELLSLLRTNARTSVAILARKLGVSRGTVSNRIRKLEDQGVIKGYRAVVDYEALGFPLLCVVRLNTRHSTQGVDDVIRAIPEVIEANRVTGSESHVIRARVRSTQHLEELLHHLWEYGDSVTNIVTSSPVPRRPMNLKRALKP